MIQRRHPTRLIPTGTCWCGCGNDAAIGSFFILGHDKAAQAAIITMKYGSVPAFLVAHGYGPGGGNPMLDLMRFHTKSASRPRRPRRPRATPKGGK
jgi:hypothetical protein